MLNHPPSFLLGMSKFGSVSTPLSDADQMEFISKAIAQGLVGFDTANIYGQGDSERLLSKVLANQRDRVFISTKIGYRLGVKAQIACAIKPLLRAVKGKRQPPVSVPARASADLDIQITRLSRNQDFSVAHLERELTQTLKRLKTDHLDALLLHSLPPDEYNESLATWLQGIKRRGIAAGVGASCATFADAEALCGRAGFDYLQVPLPVNPVRLSALGEIAARIGTRLMVRQVFQPVGSNAPVLLSSKTMLFANILGATGVSSIVVGTMNIQHLKDNLAAIGDANASLPTGSR